MSVDSRLATKYYSEAINEGEKIGEKIGEIKGKKEGLLNAIQTTLAVKFGSESLALMTILEKIDKNEALQSLFEQILKANTIEEVKRFLQ